MGTFVLVVITVSGFSVGGISAEKYEPVPIVPALTYEECHSIVDRQKPPPRQEMNVQRMTWWMETRLECWPETAK